MNTINEVKRILGPDGWVSKPEDMGLYLTDWRGRHTGKALGIALPKTTDEVASVVKFCHEAEIPMVPQGGNTGLVQGGVPRDNGNEIVINLKRMNRILKVDSIGKTATVESGVILQTLQDKAKEEGFLFPLSLGSEGSCQIGGNIATNAGGIHVLKFGPMRSLVLGLEVVLPNGTVWNGLKKLKKDNTGYDLKQLFIGAEGTLGIITRAVLKLFPAPKKIETCFVAAKNPDGLIKILTRFSDQFDERLAAFEIFPRIALDMVLKHIPNTRDPFDNFYPWYGIIELWDALEDDQLSARLEQALTKVIDDGYALDALVIQNLQQRKEIWTLRETIAEAQKQDGDGIKHDVSVPFEKIPEFIERADQAVGEILPGFKSVAFGHAGDGNIHYDPCPPQNMSQESFLAMKSKINRVVHDIVANLNGSISAEHGIGMTRRSELSYYKPDIDMELYRTIKNSLDPKGFMNPGKLV